MNLKKLQAIVPALALALATQSRGQSWTNFFRGSTDSFGWAIALDTNNGSVCVTGNAGGPCGTVKYSATGTPLWTNFFSGGIVDLGWAVTADKNGNTYVTGQSSTGVSGNDFFTIKYSSAGVPAWTNRYNGPGNGEDAAKAIKVDGAGNVFVTGYSIGTGGKFEFATIKYSPTGTLLWVNRYNGPGNSTNQPCGLALDSNENVYVAGGSVGNNGYFEYATIKYSNAGTPMWTNRYALSATASAIPTAITSDANNFVYVTGAATNSNGTSDFLTIKYSNAGALIWARTYDGPDQHNDSGEAIAVDNGGNVLVTGTSIGNGSFTEYATLAYSASGATLWVNRYGGTGNDEDTPFGIAADKHGNVYLTGFSTTAGGTNVMATLAYSHTGIPLWTNFYARLGSSFNRAYGLVVDAGGNVYIAGQAKPSNARSYVTIKYAAPLSFQSARSSLGFSNGHFGFDLSGPSGSTVVIQATTNFQTWFPLQTNVLVDGTLYFSDPQSSPSGGRFYRAQLLP